MHTRLEIATIVADAVRAAMPDRAAAVLSALEARLDAGRWSPVLAPHRPPDELMPRDGMLLEVTRAVAHARGEDADPVVRELERWLAESVRTLLDEQLSSDNDAERAEDRFAEWAADALEAGLDTPALRMLAGFGRNHLAWERDEIWSLMRRARRELGFPDAVDERCDRARARRIAVDYLCRRMSLREAVGRLTRLFPLDYGTWLQIEDAIGDEYQRGNPEFVETELNEQLALLLDRD